MMKPKLSVIVCAFNVEDNLEQCLDSILSQKVEFPFEIIVGDDVSKDETVAIIKRYHSEHPEIIKPVYRTDNLGYSANFVDLLHRAEGEYFAQVDSDDFLISDTKFSEQMAVLESNQQLVACFHNYQVIYTDREGVHPINPPFTKDTTIDFRFLLDRPLGPGNTTMIRRSALPSKIPDWIRDSANHMDYCMQTYAALSGNIYYLNKVMSCYRKHGDNITAVASRIFIDTKSLEINRELQKLYVRNGHPELKEKFNHIIASKGYRLFYSHLAEGDLFKALRFLVIGFRFAPDFRLSSHKDFLITSSPELFYRLKGIFSLSKS